MFFEMKKAKKRVAWFLVLALILTGFSVPGFSLTNVYADSEKSFSFDMMCEPSSGDGTQGTPYRISTAEELAWFSQEVIKDNTLCAVLEADIDLEGSESKQWTPIGSQNLAYIGTFNGQGHTVSGIYIKSTESAKYLGFIGNLGTDGIVKNLIVGGEISTNAGGASYAGGIAGCANSKSKIINCANYVNVSAKDGTTVGGIVGGTKGSNGSEGQIVGSFNAGKVNGKKQTGGIVGYAQFTDVSYCYNIGTINVNASEKYVGGLLGYAYKSVTLKNSFNLGSIAGGGSIGALAGVQDGITGSEGEPSCDACYWLDTSTEKGFGGTAAVFGQNEAKAASDMQSADFVALVNGENPPQDSKFTAVSGAYPVHQWQNAEMSDEDAVNGAVEALSFQTQTPLTENLTLPASGENGTSISWESDNEAVLSANGTITPQNVNTSVTLTATVEKNGIEKTKAFTFIVAAVSSSDDEEAVKAAAAALPTLFAPENGTDTNFAAYVRRILEKKEITGISVEVLDPGTPAKENVGGIASDGEISYFYQAPSTLGYSPEYVFVENIKLKLSKGGAKEEITVKARLDWDKEKVKGWLQEAVLNTITWESIKGSNTDEQAVTETLSLPVRVRDAGGSLLANLTWKSSDTTAIQIGKGEVGSDTPVSATVRAQSQDREVVLTVSAVNTKAQEIVAEKTITLNVKGDGASLSEQEKMQAMLDKHYTEDCITLAETGEKVTGAVRGDVMVPKHSRDWFDAASGLEFATAITDPDSESSTRRNYDFTLSVENAQYVEPLYPKINVYRPLPGQATATARVTITMSKVDDKSVTASKTLTFRIVPWEQQELESAVTDAKKLMSQAKDGYAAALLRDTKNTTDNITESLSPFRNVTMKEEVAVFSNDISSNLFDSYLVADEFPGYDPMKVYSGGYRTFKSSMEKVIANETLKLQGTVPEDKEISITAWLTHSQLGRYWAKYGAADTASNEDKETYKTFKDLYKNEVNATYTVKGSDGAPEPGGSSAEITVAFSYDGVFEVQPVPMTVEAGYAAQFGMGEKSEIPTVLDAAVMAHKQKYADAFTKDTASDYMNKGLTKLFTHGNGKDTYFGHYINGAYSSDMADGAQLKNGDVVYLYYYGDWNGAATADFQKDGSYLFDTNVTHGTLTLKLVRAPGFGEAEATPAKNVRVGVMNQEGELSANKIVSIVQTDSKGEFTLNFTENGTFFIMSDNACEGKVLYPAWCKVTVSGIMTETERRELVAQDKAALEISELNADGTPSGTSLTLKEQGDSGKTVINWSSDTPSVVTEGGKIIRDAQAHTVKLTAEISCGDVSEEKVFTVQVPALTEDEAEKALDAVKAKLTSAALTPSEYDGFDAQYEQGYYVKSKKLDTNILSKAKIEADNSEVKITLEKSSNDAIASDGVITYSENESIGEVTFKLTIGTQIQEHVVSIPVPAHLKTKAEYLQELGSTIDFDKIKGKNLTSSDVQTALLLPNELDVDEDLYPMAEINAEWISDHPEVIKIPSYTVSSAETNFNAVYKTEITRPNIKTIVKLTAKLSYNTEYDAYMGTLPPDALPENPLVKVITVEVNPVKNTSGGGSSGGGSSSGTSTEKESTSGSNGKVEVEAKTNNGGIANVTVSDKAVSSAIKEVLEKNSGTKKVEIEVKADSSASKVETIIPEASVAQLSGKVDAVIVKMPIATLSIDQETMKKLAENTKGNLKITAEKADMKKSFLENEKVTPNKRNQLGAKIGNRPLFDLTMQIGGKEITEFAGKVTVSIPYTLQAGEKAEGLKVYHISSDGTVTEMEDAGYSKGNVQFSTNHFSYYTVAYEASLNFNDVKTGAWYAEAVEYAVKNNLMNGVSAEAFKPNDKTTRAMMATILYNAQGKPEVNKESTFKDVEKSAWYGAAVTWASEQGIVKGMSEASFMPAANLTREQVAVMLHQYAKFKNQAVTEEKSEIEAMSDFNQISSWAKESMNWAFQQKIINGKGSGILDPKGNATRAEIAQMMKRFIEVQQ